MKFELNQITVEAIAENFTDRGEQGAFGYRGRLTIRPAYHREFVCDDARRDAVVTSLLRGYPLGVMHWVKNGDDAWEVLDGRRRILAFCRYAGGDFAVEGRRFADLTAEEKRQILHARIPVYVCEGGEQEKLEFFRAVNFAGEPLTMQELRNAVYPGPWLEDAKAKFSRPDGPAAELGRDYLAGDPLRQDYLETALNWLSYGNIEIYMAAHRNDPDAGELLEYFRSVMAWVRETFPVRREAMLGVAWGPLFDDYGTLFPDTELLERQIAGLMADPDIPDKRSVYARILELEAKRLGVFR
ncbi:MAG: DUF262 domain-containing protein [Lentisphaeria bacterium]|nr:DUF262 domain-containing protein [Lentisphaeria bacterium]